VFPEEERAKAVGIWAGFASAGGTLGILVAGGLLEWFYWGAIFIAAAAIAALALIAIVAVVPSTKATERVAFDPAGLASPRGRTGLLVLGIIEGPERGWSNPLTLVGLIGGLLVPRAFVLIELRATAPLLDPRLFRIAGFAQDRHHCSFSSSRCSPSSSYRLQYLQLVLGYGT
jgi:MFS family permease